MARRVLRFGALALVLAVPGAAGILKGCMSAMDFQTEFVESEFDAAVAQSRTTTVDDTEVRYVLVCDDESHPLIVFVHGSPGDWSAYRNYLQIAALRSHACMAALDRPGFGQTQPGEPEPDLRLQAAAVAAVIEAEAEEAIVAGHSLGGSIAAQLAANRPELVAGLLLLAPSISPALEKRRWYNYAAAFPPVGWLIPQALETSNSELWPLKSELLALEPELPTIVAPTVVIHGVEDSLVPVENAAYVAERFLAADVQVIKLAEADHFLPWNEQPLIVETLLGLLD